MKIPRLRILRHYRNIEKDLQGMWLILVEPSWPFIKYESYCEKDELWFLSANADTTSSLDVVVEYFTADGSCGKSLVSWAYDRSRNLI